MSLNNVQIEGHSKVHNIDDDCEMHFGAHTPAFQGDPDGLVLEPMNVCVQPFPGQSEQRDADWTAIRWPNQRDQRQAGCRDHRLNSRIRTRS